MICSNCGGTENRAGAKFCSECATPLAQAIASLLRGDLGAAIEQAERSATITDYFTPLAIPVAARAALWAGDAAIAHRLLETPDMARYWGPVLEADRVRIWAGIAALEDRPAEALSGFLEALREYAQLGLAFEEAAGAVDLAVLLPNAERESPAAAAAVAGAREALTRLGARPFLERLADAPTGTPGAQTPRPAARSAATPEATVASEAG